MTDVDLGWAFLFFENGLSVLQFFHIHRPRSALLTFHVARWKGEHSHRKSYWTRLQVIKSGASKWMRGRRRIIRSPNWFELQRGSNWRWNFPQRSFKPWAEVLNDQGKAKVAPPEAGLVCLVHGQLTLVSLEFSLIFLKQVSSKLIHFIGSNSAQHLRRSRGGVPLHILQAKVPVEPVGSLRQVWWHRS